MISRYYLINSISVVVDQTKVKSACAILCPFNRGIKHSQSTKADTWSQALSVRSLRAPTSSFDDSHYSAGDTRGIAGVGLF
jgi:hypothetical protein